MSYFPALTDSVRVVTGPGANPPNTQILFRKPAALWFSRGRARQANLTNFPLITAQMALNNVDAFVCQGWTGNPPVFDFNKAEQVQHYNASPTSQRWFAVCGGPMWTGTPDAHYRYDLTDMVGLTTTPPPSFPTGRRDGYTTSFDVYRPFGNAAPVVTGLVGVFYSDAINGRGSYSGGNYVMWSDFLDVASSVDVRDGSSRASGLDTVSYADGDEVRVPSGAAASRYVVVRVSNMLDLTGVLFKRVYLLRDAAHWPGP